MAFHLQTQPASGHGDYATLEEAKTDADAHPDDWQEITDVATGERWVRAGGEWIPVSRPKTADG